MGTNKKGLRQRKTSKSSPSGKTQNGSEKEESDQLKMALPSPPKRGKGRLRQIFQTFLMSILFLALYKGAGYLTSLYTSTAVDEEPPPPPPAKAEEIANAVIGTFRLLETVPHDETSFTQGLTFADDDDTVMYESTGLYGESKVRKLNVSSGEVLAEMEMDEKYFGEGMEYFRGPSGEGRLIQLTWREQKGFVYDSNTLQVVEEFEYSTTTNEGWGIAYNPDDEEFIVSDGSEYLHFWNREKQEVRKLPVVYMTEGLETPQVLKYINELEWDDRTKTVLANIWYQDLIVQINPKTGVVRAIHMFENLYKKAERTEQADSFNGIALSAKGDLWVTGKRWPSIYRVQLRAPRLM